MKETVRTIIYWIGKILFISHKQSSKVIYYHDIHTCTEHAYTSMSTPMSLFQCHISIIKKEGFEIVSEISSPSGQIQIAFDDGFRGIWDNRQWFIENHIPVTIFIPTGLIGQQGYLTMEEIENLHRIGFNIQSHGVRHTNLTKLDKSTLDDDLCKSKLFLEKKLSKEIDSICFPMGYFSDEVVSAAIHAKYKKLYTSVPGHYTGNSLQYRLFCQNSTPRQFTYILHGGGEILSSHYKKIHYKNLKNR